MEKKKTPYSDAYRKKHYLKNQKKEFSEVESVEEVEPIKEIHNIFPGKQEVKMERKMLARKIMKKEKEKKRLIKEERKRKFLEMKEEKRLIKEERKRMLFEEKEKRKQEKEERKRMIDKEKRKKRLAKEKSKGLISKVEKVLTTKKARKIEHYVVFLIYLSVFLTAGYFFLVNTNPNILPDSFYVYEISASDSLMGNNLRSLYLDDLDVLGGKTEINNESVRLIVSEKPFNFVFNPKRKILENTTAEIQLYLVNPRTEVYLNEKLIIPDLSSFEKVADFDDDEVWVKKGLTKSYYVGENNSEDFVYANYPGRDMYVFGEVSGGTPVIADYEKKMTRIKTRFRDNLKLAIYAEGDLKIEFVKQDLNWYIGKDEYTVEIVDLQGNSYFKETYEDDGEKRKGTGEFEQEITVLGRNLPKNIYYVTFTKDENNKASDSSIKDIRINSNKVLIVGRNLPLDEFEFYTEVGSAQKIGFYYWHNGKDQEIILNGTENRIIDLNESWKGERYEEELGRGEYTFEIPKGDVWIYSDVISPSESRWFYLPQKGDKNLINQDIIIIDKDGLEIDGDSVVWIGVVNVEEGSKIRIQVLDKLRTYFKKIKLVL